MLPPVMYGCISWESSAPEASFSRQNSGRQAAETGCTSNRRNCPLHRISASEFATLEVLARKGRSHRHLRRLDRRMTVSLFQPPLRTEEKSPFWRRHLPGSHKAAHCDVTNSSGASPWRATATRSCSFIAFDRRKVQRSPSLLIGGCKQRAKRCRFDGSF